VDKSYPNGRQGPGRIFKNKNQVTMSLRTIFKMEISKIFPPKRRPAKKRRHFKDFFKITPAGTITGASGNDPAGIATYTQVGALTGFSQLWLIFFTIPMLIEIEEMSARIGVVTKKGLSHVLKKHYGFWPAMTATIILLVCNIATIGADIAGMAAVLELLTGVSWLVFMIPITVILGYLLVKEKFHIIFQKNSTSANTTIRGRPKC